MKSLLLSICVSFPCVCSSAQTFATIDLHGQVSRLQRSGKEHASRVRTLDKIHEDIKQKRQSVLRAETHRARELREQKQSDYDWFFGAFTKVCDAGGVFDIDSTGPFARIFMCWLVCLLVMAVMLTALPKISLLEPTKSSLNLAEAGGLLPAPQSGDARKASKNSNSDETSTAATACDVSTNLLPASNGHRPDTQKANGERERLWHLDFARICAIGCVVFEHAGGEVYTHSNVAWGLWWALPFLYMTSGMGNVMSRSPMLLYAGRLLAILLVGVTANWIADMISGRDWQHDFPNTVFQMWFVVMLIGMTILAEPLRKALRHLKESPDREMPLSIVIATYAWGAILLVNLILYVIGFSFFPPESEDAAQNWFTYYHTLFDMAPLILAEFAAALFLPLLACLVSHPSRRGMIGWIMLVFTYAPVVFVPWDEDGFIRCLSLYIFAMVAMVLPLDGRETIAKWVQSYWPLLIMILCFFTMPEMVGRCDLHPPLLWLERLRFNMGELILVVCFMCGAFSASDPYNYTVWLGWWSLYAYCFHVAWARIFGNPYGALLTFMSIPLFWVLYITLHKQTKSNDFEKAAAFEKSRS